MTVEQASGTELDEHLALRVENVSKVFGEEDEERYVTAVSLFALLRERRGLGQILSTAGMPSVEDGGGDDEDDDEPDDELEPDDETAQHLHGVSFELRRGEAIGVVGDERGALRTLARVLCGMTAPTSGRVAMRGRASPSVELTTLLIRRETNARAAARLLAILAGPGRRHRRAFVEATLSLAYGTGAREHSLARVPKQLLRRVAVAASLDPFADILVIDEFPSGTDAQFRERCLDRLFGRLEEGAAAVVVAHDPELLDRCAQVVTISNGATAAHSPSPGGGTTASPPEDAESVAPRRARKRTASAVRGFDEHAAILAAGAVDGRDVPVELVLPEHDLRIRILFETVTPARVMVVVRLAGADSATFVREPSPLQPGMYVAYLVLQPGTVEPGEYEIAVGLVLEHDGGRTKVGRNGVAAVRVKADEEGIALAAETGAHAPAEARDAEWLIEPVDG